MKKHCKYDFLIVGSGLYGATFACMAKRAGKRCLVIDRRDHLGGNVYCERIEYINVHKYGPHIFHTSNHHVWKFVNDLVSFNRFTLSPVANYNGELYSLPFNMNTFHQMWNVKTPEEAMAVIEQQRYKGFAENLEQQALSLVGNDIYERLIKGYTEKQWGRPCSELPSFIIRRLPVRFTYDNNYFNDIYQGVPIGGYNQLIGNLLNGIECIIGVDYFGGLHRTWREIADKLVYTGKVDKFYGFCLGKLDYRSLRFETEILGIPNYQGIAQMNYTDSQSSFTRIIEHKHFECFGDSVYDNPKTVITREYPVGFNDDREAYYPINDVKNNAIYHQYKQMVRVENNVLLGGRLAEYKYYDMAQVIEKAMIDYIVLCK